MVSDDNFCWSCGTTLFTGDRFCRNCGANLKKQGYMVKESTLDLSSPSSENLARKLLEDLNPSLPVSKESQKRSVTSQIKYPEASFHLRRGNGLRDQGNRHEAIGAYSEAISISPLYDIPYLVRAFVYADIGQHKQAIEDYTQYILIADDPSDGYFNRALSYEALKQDVNAVKDYTQCIKMNPRDPIPYFYRGAVYFRIGNLESATRDYLMTVRLDPDDYSRFFSRVDTYTERGHFEQVVKEFTLIIDVYPNYGLDINIKKAFLWRGVAYSGLREYEKAIEDYNKAIELDPTDADACKRRDIAEEAIRNQFK